MDADGRSGASRSCGRSTAYKVRTWCRSHAMALGLSRKTWVSHPVGSLEACHMREMPNPKSPWTTIATGRPGRVNCASLRSISASRSISAALMLKSVTALRSTSPKYHCEICGKRSFRPIFAWHNALPSSGPLQAQDIPLPLAISENAIMLSPQREHSILSLCA